jgi:hypothetical protein
MSNISEEELKQSIGSVSNSSMGNSIKLRSFHDEDFADCEEGTIFISFKNGCEILKSLPSLCTFATDDS